jgi:hypothetical protein
VSPCVRLVSGARRQRIRSGSGRRQRIPELDLDQQEVEWTTLDDGAEALLVNGGGINGGDGAYFASYGEDVHAVGSLAPIVPGYIGCIVIKPDGSRYVVRAMPDPLAGQQPDNLT